ncbi:ABC transporter permease [Solicola gregarius]|uniref:ABC transporter permease n=1 Tax=Solicola gregarius TaxID=2908642 RepID=A0AA46TKE3_9ACTN|nr:ABC transporter permease [Solicola gregarius]UYM06725.1 ABC transporter permease [Solicola gregarius]
MIAALRYEWTRLLTVRSTYWLIIGTLVLYFFATMAVAIITESVEASSTGGTQVDAAIITLGASTGFAPLLMAYIIGVIGVLSMGHEYRHQMIRTTLTAVPKRWAVVLAKVITVAVVAAIASTLAMLVGFVNASIFSGRDVAFDAELRGLILGAMTYTALFALAGLAFAGLVRNQTGAIVTMLAMPIVIEPIVRTILLIKAATSGDPGAIGTLARYLPFEAGGKMYTRADMSDMIDTLSGVEPLGAVGGGVCMAAFVGALLLLMTVLFVRRDA